MRNEDVFYRIDILYGNENVRWDNTDIRIYYVVDGECSVYTPDGTYDLAKTDIILANSGEVAEVNGREYMLAVLSVDYFRLCSLQGAFSISFSLNSLKDTGLKYTQIRTQMQNLLMAHVSQKEADLYQETGWFYLILYTLITQFGATKSGSDPSDGRKEQVTKILHYIHSNYAEDLKLNEVADHLYLSASSVSRLFQKITGEKFSGYVKNVRLAHVKRSLEETDKSITKIAMDNGFSTPSTLNKIFKAEFGITPTEYREKNARQQEESREDRSKKDKLFLILQEDRKQDERVDSNLITVNTANPGRWKKWENRLLNVGPAYVLSNAGMQKQVLFLAHKLDIEYIRIWNLFSPKMMIGEKSYNFTFVDEIFDFCVDHKLKLFIDIAQRRDVALASEKREIYSNDDRTLFRNETEWQRLLEAFLVHIRKRYHENVVGDWIFEFSFYLNDQPYYTSANYSNRRVWDNGYELVKKKIPSARVAGPGMIVTDAREDMEAEIREFLSSDHLPDIFTAIMFPYNPEGENGTKSIYGKSYNKIANRNFIHERSEIVQNELRRQDFEGKFWITDWGSSLANRNYIQDSCFRAAFIVENFLKNNEFVGAMGIFYASDLISAYSDTNAVLSGSAGLLSRNGICKPAYYAYRFIDKLGRYKVAQAENCIVTSENERDYRILCYNNKALGPKYYLSDEDSCRPEELDRLFVNMDHLNMELRILLETEGETYTVRQRILNAQKGSVLDKWIDFGCSVNLSRGDMEYLEKIAMPEIIMERKMCIDNELRINMKLEPNEIRLITVMKE